MPHWVEEIVEDRSTFCEDRQLFVGNIDTVGYCSFILGNFTIPCSNGPLYNTPTQDLFFCRSKDSIFLIEYGEGELHTILTVETSYSYDVLPLNHHYMLVFAQPYLMVYSFDTGNFTQLYCTENSQIMLSTGDYDVVILEEGVFLTCAMIVEYKICCTDDQEPFCTNSHSMVGCQYNCEDVTPGTGRLLFQMIDRVADHAGNSVVGLPKLVEQYLVKCADCTFFLVWDNTLKCRVLQYSVEGYDFPFPIALNRLVGIDGQVYLHEDNMLHPIRGLAHHNCSFALSKLQKFVIKSPHNLPILMTNNGAVVCFDFVSRYSPRAFAVKRGGFFNKVYTHFYDRGEWRIASAFFEDTQYTVVEESEACILGQTLLKANGLLFNSRYLVMSSQGSLHIAQHDAFQPIPDTNGFKHAGLVGGLLWIVFDRRVKLHSFDINKTYSFSVSSVELDGPSTINMARVRINGVVCNPYYHTEVLLRLKSGKKKLLVFVRFESSERMMILKLVPCAVKDNTQLTFIERGVFVVGEKLLKFEEDFSTLSLPQHGADYIAFSTGEGMLTRLCCDQLAGFNAKFTDFIFNESYSDFSVEERSVSLYEILNNVS
ncbi:hypothetical protein PCE1_003424 [Barthelona sp. PCE]